MHRFIPAPPGTAVHLFIFTIHFYALSILLGIVAAIVVVRKRYVARGFPEEDIYELAAILIPTGIVGGRIYHVITSPERYFGKNGNPAAALKIWEGGMGIWGAVFFGACAAYIFFARRNRKADFWVFADALVPGLLLAQALGRWGNWFNNELFGLPTRLPWALSVPRDFRPTGYENFSTFHPTFLYESLWCLIGAFLIWKIKLFSQLNPGYLFILYISFYCLGRFGIELIRIDQANRILGLRINVWVSALGFSIATFIFLRGSKFRP
jgi:prolipoprotein diacylglyceryl transferase